MYIYIYILLVGESIEAVGKRQEMKSRGKKEDIENMPLVSIRMGSSINLLVLVKVLIVFAVGVVIGIASTSHIHRYFNFQSQQFYANEYGVYGNRIQVFDDNNCKIVVHPEKEDCLSMKSFLSPRNLDHNISDEELFWRASMVPEKEEFPFKRVPKVAFMFLTRGALPLLPLWERFFKGQDENLYSIYVHAHPAYKLNVSNTSVLYGRQIPSQHVKWGSVSLVDAEKRLLANALLDFSNERFVLLSESCIPVYNFATVYRHLTGSIHSFVQSFDEPTSDGRGRYNRDMLPDIKLSDWRKGSQWFELNRRLAIRIVSDTKYYTLFKNYCKPYCYPDEHYIPTFLHMFHGQENANRTVTYVNWSVRAYHPATFSAVNTTEGLIQSIRNNGTLCSYNFKKTSVCYLFARKFDPSALEPLLNISSRLMGF